MAVLVLGAVVLLGAIWKLRAIANRPANRNHVSAQWLSENVKRKE